MEPEYKLAGLNDDMNGLQHEISELENKIKRSERLLARAEREGRNTAPLRSQVENYRQQKAGAEYRWVKKSREVKKLLKAEKRD